jgi:ubiquinone/menaquinone biosynthesis C-methylase UbiE
MSSDAVRDAYATWSATYDTVRNLTRDLDERVTRQQLAGLRLETALEFGCGTGKNSPFLAGLARRLTAADFSPAMLAQARAKTTGRSVDFLVADISHTWPWDSAVFDLITCNLVLEHVADLPCVFGQARRVLRPGGRFYVSELHPFRQYQGSRANFQVGQENVTIPAYVHHLSDYWQAARQSGFQCSHIGEWRHELDDPAHPPRLVTFLFELLSE